MILFIDPYRQEALAEAMLRIILKNTEDVDHVRYRGEKFVEKVCDLFDVPAIRTIAGPAGCTHTLYMGHLIQLP